MLSAYGERADHSTPIETLPASPDWCMWEPQPIGTVERIRDAIERNKRRQNERDARRENLGRRRGDAA